jgi:inosine/guanosine/xanthosine phosphorylase family protein
MPLAKSVATRLKAMSPLRPQLGIVLGTGFEMALDELRVVKQISYSRLPGFPRPTVPGHAGELYLGHFGKTPVLVLSGRAHYYEGHGMEQVTFAVRVLASFGITNLLLTNAAGGINPRFKPGDFVAVSDHINFMGVNPLRGPEVSGLNRFVDLTDVYDAGLLRRLTVAARACHIKPHTGVYLAVSGPSYETPAEIRAFARLGADLVGMSTVPEAIVARQCGLKVAALSCVTNLAAGLGGKKLSHAEVLETARRVKQTGARLIAAFAGSQEP